MNSFLGLCDFFFFCCCCCCRILLLLFVNPFVFFYYFELLFIPLELVFFGNFYKMNYFFFAFFYRNFSKSFTFIESMLTTITTTTTILTLQFNHFIFLQVRYCSFTKFSITDTTCKYATMYVYIQPVIVPHSMYMLALKYVSIDFCWLLSIWKWKIWILNAICLCYTRYDEKLIFILNLNETLLPNTQSDISSVIFSTILLKPHIRPSLIFMFLYRAIHFVVSKVWDWNSTSVKLSCDTNEASARIGFSPIDVLLHEVN